MTDFKNKLQTEKSSRRFGLKQFNLFLFCLIAMAGLAYIICINDLTVKGFALQEMRGELRELALQNEDIEAQIMAIQSYNNLAEKVKDLDMVAVGEVEYLTVNVALVAKR